MIKIIAIDFDGTCVQHKYPEIGKEVQNCVKVLKGLNENDVRLILWTMRSGETLAQAIVWFEKREIELWAINDNPEQEDWTDSRKVYAPLYIDDAALGCPTFEKLNGDRPYVNWYVVELVLKEKGYLKTI